MTHGLGVSPRPVALDERSHDPFAKELLEIEGQMRDPEAVAQSACPADGLRRAACRLAVGPLVRPELVRHGNDVRPALALQHGRDRRVDAAGDGHERPLTVLRSERLAGGRQRRKRPGQGVAGQLGRVGALRRETADALRDSLRAQERRLEHARVLHGLAGCRRAGAQRRTPRRFERSCGDAAVIDKERDPHQITAG